MADTLPGGTTDGVLDTERSVCLLRSRRRTFLYCCNRSIKPLLRFQVNIDDGLLQAYPYRPSGWTHFVPNYVGPNNGDGIRIFYDGVEVGSDTTKGTNSFPTGDGRIAVGRRFTNEDRNYPSVQVDDLVFFNRNLSLADIQAIFNAVWKFF